MPRDRRQDDSKNAKTGGQTFKRGKVQRRRDEQARMAAETERATSQHIRR